MEVQPSAYSTLIEVAQQIQLLNDLYLLASQSCIGKESMLQGHGNISEFVNHPGQTAQRAVRQLSYLETMNHIRSFLKFLAGEQLTKTEQEQLNSYSYTESALGDLFDPLFHSRTRGNFIAIIDGYINWLNAVITRCGGQYTYQQNNFSAAAANLVRIAKRFKLMETFYEQVTETCAGLENYVLGTGTIERVNPEYEQWETQVRAYQRDPFNVLVPSRTPPPYQITVQITFGDIMQAIDLSLKFFSDQQLTDAELNSFEGIPVPNLLFPFGMSNGQLQFDARFEPYLTWLYETLNQCRLTQVGILETQTIALERLYSPTSQYAQNAQQRFNTQMSNWKQ